MRFLFRLIIFCFLFQSCNSNEYKDKLIGNWSLIHGSNEYEFYKDSMVVRSFGQHYTNSWSVENDILHFKVIKQHFSDIDNKEFYLFYKLSDNGDTLYLRNKDETDFNVQFLRIYSAYDYLLKEAKIEVELPIKKDVIKNNNANNIDIFVGYRNDILTSTTLDYRTSDLSEIAREVHMERLSRRYADISDYQFNLIIDQNVKRHQIDSIKTILKKTKITKMFRVYTNTTVDYNKVDWLSDFDWYGIYED
ncbi:hypothetical protein [uncultured Psychroserpens sp.]|uniref:hypothetical protein n=1 Tax=uncultured Psychroserpens sp. TaxID=255436 RepID=UPI0026053900|nr:hypothetical protein [uncultured Psychroserpens sp.]